MRTDYRSATLVAIVALATGCIHSSSSSTTWSSVSAGSSMHLADCRAAACDISVKNTGRIPLPLMVDSGGVTRWFRTLASGATFESVMAYREVLIVTNSSMQTAQLQVWTSADDRRDTPFLWLRRP